MTRTYLDFNATAPLRPEARAAVIAAMDVVGNPSSVHAEGRAAKSVIEKARGQVANAVGCLPDEVVFTAGATEAAMVLESAARHGEVWVDPTAHDALYSHAGGAVPGGPSTLAMGLANSETGIVTEPGTKTDGSWRFGERRADWLLVDITQAVGRIPFSYSWSGADMAVLSAHKLGGPKGVGALIVKRGLDISPLSTGGGQEMGRRSGTENIAGIAGFGAAIEASVRDLESGVWAEVEKLRNILETALATGSNETILVGKEERRLPNTTCLVTPGWKGETQVMQLDLAGFAVSSGSACSSGKVRTSRVLRAMGFDERAAGSAVRVSLGPTTTEDEVRAFADAWLALYEKFRRKAA